MMLYTISRHSHTTLPDASLCLSFFLSISLSCLSPSFRIPFLQHKKHYSPTKRTLGVSHCPHYTGQFPLKPLSGGFPTRKRGALIDYCDQCDTTGLLPTKHQDTVSLSFSLCVCMPSGESPKL